MGYSYDDRIKTFWPDDTDEEFYIARESDLGDILDRAQQKWPGCQPEQVNIEAEHIHTHALTHDEIDLGDYTSFLRVHIDGEFLDQLGDMGV